LMTRAVHSGLPVVRVGRGNTKGLVPLDNPLFIGGSNLTATRARLSLMACLMKFGALPPAANADQPTAEETAAVREKVAEYQAVFKIHWGVGWRSHRAPRRGGSLAPMGAVIRNFGWFVALPIIAWTWSDLPSRSDWVAAQSKLRLLADGGKELFQAWSVLKVRKMYI